MPAVTYVSAGGQQNVIEAPVGVSVMQAAVDAGIPGIVGECGGSQACATCHVYVDPIWAKLLPPIGSDESAMLDAAASERRESSRLSCQIKLVEALDGLVVEIPATQY